MLVQEKSEVWGIGVPTSAGGRRKWPEAIRVMAVERILAGHKIVDIAQEIGANKSLVAKWVKTIATTKTAPSFVELVRPEAADKNMPSSSPEFIVTCHLQEGDTGITVSAGYPATHLADVLRAVRVSQ